MDDETAEYIEDMTPAQVEAWKRIDTVFRLNIGRSLPEMPTYVIHRMARIAVFAYENDR